MICFGSGEVPIWRLKDRKFSRKQRYLVSQKAFFPL